MEQFLGSPVVTVGINHMKKYLEIAGGIGAVVMFVVFIWACMFIDCVSMNRDSCGDDMMSQGIRNVVLFVHGK